MKISVGVVLYWFAGMLLDMLYGLRVTDFCLPSDFIQQIEVEIISHVIIFATWSLGLAVWVWALNKVNKRRNELRNNRASGGADSLEGEE